MAKRTVKMGTERVPLVNVVEELVDQAGITAILEAMGNVCELKAEHLVAHWQDTATAARWAKVGRRLGNLSRHGWEMWTGERR